MATVSLKPEDANKLDFRLNDFTPDQRTALAGWHKHFLTKYPVVGTLKEYDGWDFSEIEKEAESQTPFGAGKTEDEPKSSEAEPAPKPAASQGLELRKGG